jgi:hypothetical protein
MQMVLRPVAIRALLLIAGVVLGVVAFLTAYAATTAATSHSADAGVAGQPNGDTTISAGVHWN